MKNSTDTLKKNSIYNGSCFELIKKIDNSSIDLVLTSPPYADIRKSYYGPKPSEYVEWFLPLALDINRVLKPNGSFILNIKDRCVNGARHPYVFDLVVQLSGFLQLIDTNIWVKKNGLGSSKARRPFDYFEYVFHFCNGNKPVWNPDAVRTPYAATSLKRSEKPIKANTSNREAREVDTYKEWKLNPLGAYPKNILYFKKDAGKDHPAAFDIELPTHFIKAHTNNGDVVLDPFMGRGTTCEAAKKLNRSYIGIELKEEYWKIAKGKGL